MTSPDPPPTEADRKAAAKWAKSNSRHAQAANILRGSCDSAPLVQAFARHAQQAREEEREACAKVIEEGQETNSNTAEGSETFLTPRYEGNRAGLGYADAIRNRSLKDQA